jgi:hypothetical protein
MRWSTLLGALLLATSWASASAEPVKVVAVERFAPTPTWSGPQKVQADKAGHVFLLRTDTLEVYPVGKGGRLGEPSKLEAASPINAPVLDAAMGPGGPGDWLLRLPMEVHWFVDGKEKPLPRLIWRPWGVGYVRSTPVVSVLPLHAPANGTVVIQHGKEESTSAPVVMALAGDRWSPLIETAWPEQRDINSMTETCARLLLGDRAGKLWSARTYGYVLERYSPAGRPLSKVLVDKGKAEHLAAKDVKAPAEVRQEDRPHFKPFLGVFKISDLAEGFDHRIYLLVQPGNGEAGVYLDRYDPTQSLLERVTLGVELKGMATLAVGRDGLYMAGHGGDQGRWRVSWEVLDLAEWKHVMTDSDSAPPAFRAPGKPGS